MGKGLYLSVENQLSDDHIGISIDHIKNMYQGGDEGSDFIPLLAMLGPNESAPSKDGKQYLESSDSDAFFHMYLKDGEGKTAMVDFQYVPALSDQWTVGGGEAGTAKWRCFWPTENGDQTTITVKIVARRNS